MLGEWAGLHPCMHLPAPVLWAWLLAAGLGLGQQLDREERPYLIANRLVIYNYLPRTGATDWYEIIYIFTIILGYTNDSNFFCVCNRED